MQGELVRCWTSDRFEMAGFYVPPQPGKPVVLHMHGYTGNFYENRWIDTIGEALAAQGLGFLSGNNRGHDYLGDSWHKQENGRIEQVLIGSWRENLIDCVVDIQGWLDFLTARGIDRIYLQGHSLGCTKIVYAMSQRQWGQVIGLVLLSPPDSIGRRRVAQGEEGLRKSVDRALALVQAGQNDTLVSDDPSNDLTTAQAAMRYVPGGVGDVFPFEEAPSEFPILAQINRPILALIGTVNEAVVGDPVTCLQLLKVRATSAPSVDIKAIEGANHGYVGYEHELATTIAEWVSGRALKNIV